MRLVFASNNAHKLSEMREIMPAGIEVLSLREIGFEQEIEETGSTLEENSMIKAEAVCQWLKANGQWSVVDGVFADDTGLEIDALDGAPGVYTARWYMLNDGKDVAEPLHDEMAVYAANRAKALRVLSGHSDRGCQFRTVVTLIRATGERQQVAGVVRGEMTRDERGTSGFGYDAIFMPEGYDKTFGELPAEVKNGISHRARAMQALIACLQS